MIKNAKIIARMGSKNVNDNNTNPNTITIKAKVITSLVLELRLFQVFLNSLTKSINKFIY